MTATLVHRTLKSVRSVIKERIKTGKVIGGPYLRIRRNHWDRLSTELKGAMRMKVILHTVFSHMISALD